MNAVCPKCGSNRNVTYQYREGGKGRSRDVWSCSQDGTFTTPAR